MTGILGAAGRNSIPVLTILAFLGLWQILVVVFEVPSWLLPSPLTIWTTFLKHASMLGRHVVATGTGAVGGLIIGAVGGIALAVLMVQSRLLERILMPLLVIDQSIPKMALAPIFVIWFGAGMMSRIVIATVISFFPMIVNTVRGMKSVDPRVNQLMETLSARRWHVLTKVRMPNAVPYVFMGLKVAVPLAIIGAVVAEFMQADFGPRLRRAYRGRQREHAAGIRCGRADGVTEPWAICPGFDHRSAHPAPAFRLSRTG